MMAFSSLCGAGVQGFTCLLSKGQANLAGVFAALLAGVAACRRWRSQGSAACVTTAARAAKIYRSRKAKMPAVDPDDLPKKKITHELGQELSLLSVTELSDRVALLKDEIARLEAEMNRKRASKSAADTFFKK
jgi:uncharacterized small protein (DUF1192 family)